MEVHIRRCGTMLSLALGVNSWTDFVTTTIQEIYEEARIALYSRGRVSQT